MPLLSPTVGTMVYCKYLTKCSCEGALELFIQGHYCHHGLITSVWPGWNTYKSNALSCIFISFNSQFWNVFSRSMRFFSTGESHTPGWLCLCWLALAAWDVSALFQISYEIVPWSLKWAYYKEVFGNVLLWPWMHPLPSGPQDTPVLWLGRALDPGGEAHGGHQPREPQPLWSPDVYT